MIRNKGWFALSLVLLTAAASGLALLSPGWAEDAQPVMTQPERNKELNERFDAVFETQTLTPLLDFANRQLPPLPLSPAMLLLSVTPAQPATRTKAREKEGQELVSGPVRLQVTREGGVRIFYHNRQITTDRRNIPNTEPWFNARDPLGHYATRHVARGTRFLDPWFEGDWPKVSGIVQGGTQNWPPADRAFGPLKLTLLPPGPHQAILAALPDANPVSAYGAKPRAVFAVNPDASIVMAVQQKNENTLGIPWAAWFVLGFAMPDTKGFPQFGKPQSIFAFPNPSPNPSLGMPDAPENPHMTRMWNNTRIEGETLTLIDPALKNPREPFSQQYRDVHWNILAHKGATAVILTRSALTHDQQFFPFLQYGHIVRRTAKGLLQPAGGFMEEEFTGPKVPPGEKSTVIVRYDFIPVAALTGNRVRAFSTADGPFEREVRDVLKTLVKYDQAGQLTPNDPVHTPPNQEPTHE